MKIASHATSATFLGLVALLSCCMAVGLGRPYVYPNFPRYRTQEINIETVYRTVHKTVKTTLTEFPTCTSVASGIEPCTLKQVARTERAMVIVTIEASKVERTNHQTGVNEKNVVHFSFDNSTNRFEIHDEMVPHAIHVVPVVPLKQAVPEESPVVPLKQAVLKESPVVHVAPVKPVVPKVSDKLRIEPSFLGDNSQLVDGDTFLAPDDISNDITPDLRLIIVKLTTTETTHMTFSETCTETTVGITYNGCIPTDAPKASVCP